MRTPCRLIMLAVAMTIADLGNQQADADPGDELPTAKDQAEGFRYSLMTAESRTAEGKKYVVNFRGQIGLVSDMKRTGFGNAFGICGMVWRGEPPEVNDSFSMKLEPVDGGEAYQNQKMAYDITGKDRTVTLQDQHHGATSWRQVLAKEEWFKKYNFVHLTPIQLQATRGEFAGYYLDFGEPELVKVPDIPTEAKDRSYVRRQAILVKDPSELSVFYKLGMRSR